MQLAPAEPTAPIGPGHVDEEGVLRLYLPVPPSVNALYRKGKWGNKYRDPKLVADEGDQIVSIRQVIRRDKWTATLPVKMEIILYWKPQPGKRRDLDNILKVLFDRLAKAMSVDDDWFQDIHLMRVPTDEESYVKVRIWGSVNADG